MADTDGGIMQKILALTSPPYPSPTSKQRRGKNKIVPSVMTRQTCVDNRSYCDACGDGGELLCCERCPASFHFGCCDPPLDPLHLPEGEWVCHGCRPSPSNMEDHPNEIFRPLLIQGCSENPLVFSLPEDMMNIVAVRDIKQERRLKQDSNTIRFCYTCGRTSRFGIMMNCDFCPLSYHMNCLYPPLTHQPISSSWMCPNHVEHKITELHSARLTDRLKALETCRADVSRLSIKMDFIRNINRIPHYKRNGVRTNRRASEVPPAIKSLYAQPLDDSIHTPSLIELLLTASEQLEVLRREEERERNHLGLSSPPALTQEEDEWTRHAVLSQVQTSNEENPSLQHNHINASEKTATLKDLEYIFETDLSNWKEKQEERNGPLQCNGVLTNRNEEEDEEDMIVDTQEMFNGMETSIVNTSVKTPLNKVKRCNEDSLTNHEDNEIKLKEPQLSFIPDVCELDEQLVHLLAKQRIQQLFTQNKNKTEESHDGHMTHNKPLNGLVMDLQQPTVFHRTHRQLFTKRKHENYSSDSLGIVCPLSSYGPVHQLLKPVITIGSGSEMDICLHQYGHCNYISSHHACLTLDKDNNEYELINYSEHGSIVDGVLYSCDFSDKTSSTEQTPVLFLDDIISRGSGIRAERAKKRIESVRKTLQDKSRAKKTVNAALKLCKSIRKDCSPDPSTLTAGNKRARSTETPSDPSSPASSIVSIPLSKTKRSTPDQNTPERFINNRKRATPDKRVELNHSVSGTHLSSPDKHSDIRPCMCKRSASSLIGSGGKGWEGAAIVNHGSRLRFGCIQLVLSITDRLGHNELLHALTQTNLL